MNHPQDARAARARRRRRAVMRRRMIAVGVIAGIGIVIVIGATTRLGHGGDRASATQASSAPELPRGGTRIFPRYRVVAFYGAPQDAALGTLGIGTPTEAAARLAEQASDYDSLRRPVLPAFELLASIATFSPGPDGTYRTRQADDVIRRYLESARQAGALLILDVQPGRSPFMDEVRRLRPFLEEPDVGLALDPEWSMGTGQVPGKVFGSTDAATVNAVSAYLAAIVRERNLPQKLLIVHQFLQGMIRQKNRLVKRRELALVVNVDGFGTPANKVSKYDLLSTGRPRFRNGFKLFYDEDRRGQSRLMTPAEVLALSPSPDVIVYE
ncbi:MAG TPA: hypothetical protein VKD47_03610 [Miltoncostaeaceae bacterium]|nr:hypothetical protein [Miltoncostaeaceae bacterium]